MQYRELGRSGVKISEISLGCWTMGGLNWVNGTPNGWANVDEDEVIAAIKSGIDAGVNHFDNADVYGNGRAERMLARAFDKLGLNSTDYVIATKVGHFPGTAAHAYEPALPAMQTWLVLLGTGQRGRLGKVALWDVAPTVAHQLGIPWSSPRDGSLLPRLR